MVFKTFIIYIYVQITYECVSLTFHPFGTALVAGSVEGYLVILNAENGSVVSSVRVCGSALTCMGFNPGINIRKRCTKYDIPRIYNHTNSSFTGLNVCHTYFNIN